MRNRDFQPMTQAQKDSLSVLVELPIGYSISVMALAPPTRLNLSPWPYRGIKVWGQPYWCHQSISQMSSLAQRISVHGPTLLMKASVVFSRGHWTRRPLEQATFGSIWLAELRPNAISQAPRIHASFDACEFGSACRKRLHAQLSAEQCPKSYVFLETHLEPVPSKHKVCCKFHSSCE